MRYILTENPYIWARFNSGDTPTITIYKSSDNSVIVNADSMSELGTTGFFKYHFAPLPSSMTNYFYIAKTVDEEHAGSIILGGYPSAILSDTNELQNNQGNWLTATGFATQNPPSQNINDYKADVSKLDVAISTRAPKNEYDIELSNIQSEVGGLNGESMRGTDNVPINPVLANDPRLDDVGLTIEEHNKLMTGLESDIPPLVWNEIEAIIIKKMIYNKVTKHDDIITIYENDGTTVWKQFNLADGGRVEI